ncbi:hypothetical protein LZ30DRAFT_337273 [Colletotrichum cereale]|nr:hypothetical protein LZ30DRAFT_337273 [Colletotrichum cereale]
MVVVWSLLLLLPLLLLPCCCCCHAASLTFWGTMTRAKRAFLRGGSSPLEMAQRRLASGQWSQAKMAFCGAGSPPKPARVLVCSTLGTYSVLLPRELQAAGEVGREARSCGCHYSGRSNDLVTSRPGNETLRAPSPRQCRASYQ